MSKKLVAYFSATGVTANVARQLAEACHADLYEIKPQVPYTKADLDWKDKNHAARLRWQTWYRAAIAIAMPILQL